MTVVSKSASEALNEHHGAADDLSVTRGDQQNAHLGRIGKWPLDIQD
jgi:hypothetical protein